MEYKRFWNKVNKLGPRPAHRPGLGRCWLWTGRPNDSRGYARFGVDSKSIRVHRYAYELVVGKIPRGKELDHLCRIRSCVRPSHLEPKTHLENVMAPGSKIGIALAAFQRAKTHCPSGHPYNEINTYRNPNGHRTCKSCRNIRRRKNVALHPVR